MALCLKIRRNTKFLKDFIKYIFYVTFEKNVYILKFM